MFRNGADTGDTCRPTGVRSKHFYTHLDGKRQGLWAKPESRTSKKELKLQSAAERPKPKSSALPCVTHDAHGTREVRRVAQPDTNAVENQMFPRQRLAQSTDAMQKHSHALPCGSAPHASLQDSASLHNAPIFRLLLKVAVKGTHQCDFLNF